MDLSTVLDNINHYINHYIEYFSKYFMCFKNRDNYQPLNNDYIV